MIDNNPASEGAQVERSDGAEFQSVGKCKYGNNYKKRFLDDKTEYSILKNYFTEESVRKIFVPYFEIESLIHQKYYWSVVLSAK